MGYCPTAGDMNFEYGNIHWANDGWQITGDSRISSKTSFNLLGGYIEFDMDTTKAHGGVNTNIYTVSMQGNNCGKDCYCDIQDNGSPVCMELDITENNGNRKFASTWHTVPGNSGGKNGCDAGGCAYNGNLPGNAFHMKSTWGEDGNWLTFMNSQPLHPKLRPRYPQRHQDPEGHHEQPRRSDRVLAVGRLGPRRRVPRWWRSGLVVLLCL